MAGRRGSSSPPCGWRQTRLMGSSGRRLKICPVRPLPPLPASTAQQWRHRLAFRGEYPRQRPVKDPLADTDNANPRCSLKCNDDCMPEQSCVPGDEWAA
jgi:hypothetical protein